MLGEYGQVFNFVALTPVGVARPGSSFPLPAILLFQDRPRAVAVQPTQCGWIVADAGIPERRGKRQDGAMVVRVASTTFTRKRAVAEG